MAVQRVLKYIFSKNFEKQSGKVREGVCWPLLAEKYISPFTFDSVRTHWFRVQK